MQRPATTLLRVGAWRVDPVSGQISKGDAIVRMEARTMRLLICLAERAGEVVSIDELFDQVWAGVIVTPDSVYQAIATLRRYLADDPKEPTYIATVPRLGYRMIATVTPWTDVSPAGMDPSSDSTAVKEVPPTTDSPTAKPKQRYVVPVVGAAIILAIVAAYLAHSRLTNPPVTGAPRVPPPQRSVAVLPFLDLTTQEMNEEYFADGITEELIGDLSGTAGLRVAAPTSSFYFKGKQMPIADIARQLGVSYVVDGSVRKSGSVFRVATRLVRADNGSVVYAETYERTLGDPLSVQKDIAAKAAIAIRNAVEGAELGSN
jgi:transcriptional activator of cad operon